MYQVPGTRHECARYIRGRTYQLVSLHSRVVLCDSEAQVGTPTLVCTTKMPQTMYVSSFMQLHVFALMVVMESVTTQLKRCSPRCPHCIARCTGSAYVLLPCPIAVLSFPGNFLRFPPGVRESAWDKTYQVLALVRLHKKKHGSYEYLLLFQQFPYFGSILMNTVLILLIITGDHIK